MLLFKHLLIGTGSMSVVGVTGYGIHRAVEGYEEDNEKIVVETKNTNDSEYKKNNIPSWLNEINSEAIDFI